MVFITKQNIFIVRKIFRLGLGDEFHIYVIEKNSDITIREDFKNCFRR